MANYTVLEAQDIEAICQYFGLSITASESMAGGAGNSSYLFRTTAGEKLVVTVFDDKPLATVIELMQLLQHFAAEGFVTNQIVAPANGSSPVMVLAGKPVLVKRFLSGEVIEQLDEAMLEQVGARMAALHQISPPAYLPTVHAYGKQFFQTLTQRGIDPAYESWLAAQGQRLNAELPANLPTCIIHGDLFYDNILFEGQTLKALIDFEETCHYSRIFDMGMAVLGTCNEAGQLNLEKTAALVRGYQQQQPLAAIEIKHLQNFVAYAAIATSTWRFWKYNIHEPLPDKASHHWEMAQFADAVRAIPDDVFLKAIS